MTRPGRLTTEAERRRGHVEEAMMTLSSTLTLIDETVLRVRQALRRSPVVGSVLQPALHRLAEIHRQVRHAKKELNEFWVEEQERRWG